MSRPRTRPGEWPADLVRQQLRRLELRPGVVLQLAAFAVALIVTAAIIRSPFFRGGSAAALGGLFALAVVLGALGARWPVPSSTRAELTMLRAILAVLLFYALTASHGPPVGESHRLLVLRLGQIVAIVTALGAWWRPTLGLPLLLYVAWYRGEQGRSRGGDWGGAVDFLPIVYLGVVLLAGLVMLTLLSRWRPQRLAAATGGGGPRPGPVLALCAIALFFANYFWSGYDKLVLKGPALSWVLENQTDLLVRVALDVGTLPIASWTALTEWLLAVLPAVRVELNAVTLALELLPVLALLRVRWTVWMALLLVALHAAIFLLSGVFFWKWLLIDLAIARALWPDRSLRLAPAVQIVLVLIVLGSPRLVRPAHLGWYDTASYNNAYLVALTDDGAEYRVPSNYLLNASVGAAQIGFGLDPLPQAFDLALWGHTTDIRVMRQANRCRAPLAPTSSREHSRARRHRYLRAFHQWALSKAGDDGRLLYDLYPHHIWSDPFSFDAFRELDKRRIVAYRYVVERVCFEQRSGRTVRRVQASASDTIALP